MNKYELKPLPDETILEKSSGLVTNASRFHVDGEKFTAIPGGIYDANIFGQKYRCRCGKTHRPGNICHKCGVEVLDDTTEYKRFGHFKLAYPVVYGIKKSYFLGQLMKLLGLLNFKIEYDKNVSLSENIWYLSFQAIEMSDGNITDKSGKKYGLLIEDINDSDIEYGLNDFQYLGMLGLYNICNNYTGLNLTELKSCINHLIIVSPTATRPAAIGYNGKLSVPELSSKYAELIYISNTVGSHMSAAIDLIDKITLSLIIEKAVNNLLDSYSLVATSKASTIRYLTKIRLPKSGRANAVSVSNIAIDEVMIPEALAYEALKVDIIDKIRQIEQEKQEKDPTYIPKDPKFMYNNMTPLALKVMRAIAEGDLEYDETGSVVVINRAPTLHKLSMMAFKVRLWDEPAIGVHIDVVKPFNLDFDGDQVAFYFETKDPGKTRTLNKMSPKYNWFYEKNQQPIFTPTNSMLLGLYHATRLVQGENVNEYFRMNDIIEDYIEKKIDYNEVIKFNGEITSYGRETISKIIGIPLSNLIGEDPINAKNIAKIVSIIGSKDDRVEILSKLIDFSRSIITTLGNSVLTLDEVYNWIPRFDKLEEIMNSKMDPQEKYIRVEKLIPEIISENIKKLSGTSYGHALASGATVKKQSLVEMFSPQVTYNKRTNEVNIEYDSLITGLPQDELIHHASLNREILEQKAALVPISGYFTKQIVDFLSDIIYRTDKLSEDTQGVLMYRCMAQGRTLITGELVTPNDSYDLVRVKSCVYSDKPYVCKDEINYNFFKYPNNYRIGYSLTTSTTEDVTQSQLGLKHGGQVYFPDPGMLVWEKDLTLESYNDRKLIVRDSDNVIIEFPINSNVLMSYALTQGFVKAGDPVLFSKRVNYVDNKLASFKSMMGLSSKKLKTNIIPVDCYAFNDGTIHYDYDLNIVFIDSMKYKLSRDEVYLYPEGYKVSLGDRICTGVLNTKNLMSANIDIGKKYFVFSKAVVELLINEFKAGKLPIALESLELIMKQFFHNKSVSVSQANRHNPALLSSMKGGYCKQTLTKNVGKEVKDDLLMRLLFNNNNLTDYGD